jgi:glutamine amidotransferase
MNIILNYGVGNVGSIYNMCKFIVSDITISDSLEQIEKATSLILPGVGSFDHGMKQLNKIGLIDLLNHKVLVEKVPILGICLGMQLMTLQSEEGDLAGLSWVNAKCKKFDFGLNEKQLKIPHMGWNDVSVTSETNLFPLIDDELRFYFAHSYHIECDSDVVLATTNFGYEFPVAIKKDNILGVQFHPEKSHRFGMNLLKGFLLNKF